ncbi:MAG: hypothetical protein ACFCVD_19805 [Nodosilinea sp.]
MKLWLVCFLLLFFAAEGLQWLGQLPWLSGAELSLPWIVAGGIGLAIASNAAHWGSYGRGATLSAKDSATLPSPAAGGEGSAAPARLSTVCHNPATTQKPASISFEIRKP